MTEWHPPDADRPPHTPEPSFLPPAGVDLHSPFQPRWGPVAVEPAPRASPRNAILVGLLALLVNAAVILAGVLGMVSVTGPRAAPSSAPTGLAATSAPPYTPHTEPTGPSSWVTDLAAGQCANGLFGGEDTVGSVTVVACSGPHDGELLAVFPLPNGKYPGEDATSSKADKMCEDRVGGLAAHGTTAGESVILWNLYPAADDWPEDRTALCFAIGTNGEGSKLAAPVAH